jgi:chromate transporter
VPDGKSPPPRPGAAALRELAALFLRLGATAFGGPAAHIALMEQELVRRRRWLTHDEFLDLLGATNLIPGPNSTEMAIHIGRVRAGVPGLIVAGACFILPAAVLVSSIAWAYVRYSRLPAVSAVLYGVKPVILAVVLQALWMLGRSALKRRGLWALGALAGTAAALGGNELGVLLLSGLLALGARAVQDHRSALLVPVAPAGALGALATAATPAAEVALSTLFAVFLKIGAVLFGSGYVLLAFLRADLVERLGWLTETQLLDAIAVGQITPGPVFTTATFVGYLLRGPAGAAVATVGIFLPAFLFVAASGPLIPFLRRSRLAGAFLDGVNVASLALMAVVTAELGTSAVVDGWTAALAVASAAVLLRFPRINSAWLVLAGAAAGVAVRMSSS